MKTFEELQNNVLRWLDEVDDQDTMRALVKQTLNDVHTSRCNSERWAWMEWPPTLAATFEFVASQRNYSLPTNFARPIYFYNRTKKQFLSQVKGRNFVPSAESVADWVTEVGEQTGFRLAGYSPVKQQPPVAGSTVVLTSSDVSEASTNGLTITGDTEDGQVTETVVVNATSTAVFTRIIKYSKTGTWSGTLTLKDSSTNTLLTLGADEYGKQYPQLQLMFSPQSTDTIEYRYYRKPVTMVEDNDTPDLPSEYQDILVYDTLLRLLAYNEAEPNAVKVWMEAQMRLETRMLESLLAETEGGEAEYVRYANEDDNF